MPRKTTKKPEPRKARKARPIKNWLAKVGRFLSRVVWARVATRGSAFIGFAIVESAVATVVWKYSDDFVTGLIIVTLAIMTGIGLMFGPSYAVTLRRKEEAPLRKVVTLVTVLCAAGSMLNLSTSLHNGAAEARASAIQNAPTFEADAVRLVRLDRMVDATVDEQGEEYQGYKQERDELRARLDGAYFQPVVVSDNLAHWAKAFMFHGLLAGFSAAFAGPLLGARRRSSKRPTRRALPRGVKAVKGNVSFADF